MAHKCGHFFPKPHGNPSNPKAEARASLPREARSTPFQIQFQGGACVTTPHNHVLVDYENGQPELASRLAMVIYAAGQSWPRNSHRYVVDRLECAGPPCLVLSNALVAL